MLTNTALNNMALLACSTEFKWNNWNNVIISIHVYIPNNKYIVYVCCKTFSLNKIMHPISLLLLNAHFYD